MTDEHGSDSQPPHEEVPEQEHTAQPVEAAVWPDDHPPVDDFADSGSASEDAASVSQEASPEGEEAGMSSSTSSRSMLPLFAGIGGILLIGAVIYWQFGHSSPPPMMTMQTSAPKTASSLSANSKPSTSAPAANKTEPTDITSLYKPATESASLPPPTEASPTTSMAPPESAAPPPAMPAAPAPVNPPSPPQAAVASAPPVMAPAPVAAPPVVPAPPPQSDARVDALAARMDSLQKSVDTETQQINQISAMVAANQVMPPSSNQVNPALEDRLNKIEQSLLQIEHKEVAKPSPVSMPAETAASPEVMTKTPSVHHVKPVKRKLPVHKKTAHHAAPAPSAPLEMAPTPTATSLWVLRAATPSEAWVSADPHSAELRHVQIGDTLSGVGQIRSIHQTPSGWEIDGTAGIIR